MEINGNRMAQIRLEINAPANNAIANWGAKPKGRAGITRYKEASRIMTTRDQTIDLFTFITVNIGKSNLKQGNQFSLFSDFMHRWGQLPEKL